MAARHHDHAVVRALAGVGNGDLAAQPEDGLGLCSGANAAIGTSPQDGHAQTGDRADQAGQNTPTAARPRCRQTLLGDGDWLRSLECGELDLALIDLQLAVALELRRVLAAKGLQLGTHHLIVGVGQGLGLERLDLGLQRIQPGQRRRLTIGLQRVLPFGQIRDQLVGKGVGDGHRLVGRGLGSADAKRGIAGVDGDGDLRGQRCRHTLVVQLLRNAARYLAGHCEQLQLVEGHGIVEHAVAERGGGQQQRVAGLPLRGGVDALLRRRDGTNARTQRGQQHDDPPSPACGGEDRG